MRVRHKVPSIFSISMVDMLCCALGCVILVWLLNAKLAEDSAAERTEQIDSLTRRAESERAESRRLLADAKTEHDRASDRVRELTSQRAVAMAEAADLRRRLGTLQQNYAGLQKDLAIEQQKAKDLTGKVRLHGERVATLEAEARDAAKRLETERQKVAGLAKQLDEKESVLKSARADLTKRELSLKNLQADLAAAQASYRAERDRVAAMEKTNAATEKLRAQADALLKDTRAAKDKTEASLQASDKALDAARGKLALLEKRITERQTALDAADARLALAEKEARAAKDKAAATLTDRDRELLAAKSKLALLEKLAGERLAALDAAGARLTQAERDKRALIATAESRFAGIELTGRRVIFLVDSSGSMDMIDEKTEAPSKWTEVRLTVAKLIRSLPKLEKYQLITFGPTLAYPMGSQGKWLDPDRTSPDTAAKTLAAVRPNGGTNMYIALAEAFRFRKDGLDTIYILSDGLPNQGEGLTPTENATLGGIERGAALGKHIRTMLRTKWNVPIAKQRVRLNTVGFFFESPDLGSFLWALARENDGSFVGMSRP